MNKMVPHMTMTTEFTQAQIDLAKKRLHYPSELELLNEVRKIAEQATQEQYITADEAKALGAGNAEWLQPFYKEWCVCDEYCRYDMSLKYRAIIQTEPTCQVRNLVTGELKTMTREAAQKLQVETKDTCDWFYSDGEEQFDDSIFGFDSGSDEPYTYKLKQNLVKLDGKLMTREAAIALWESKKDTHVMWFLMPNYSQWSDVLGYPNDTTEYFSESFATEYQLREKPKKQSTLDPAIREGVIALLEELKIASFK